MIQKNREKITGSTKQSRKKRRVQFNKILSLSVFSFVLIAALSIGCFGTWSQARDMDKPQIYKYYTNIEIQYGETLWDIASRYCGDSYLNYDAYINEVMIINRMAEPKLTAGSYLIVPYFSTEFMQ
ncbi:MAG: LysM peptidoglycan-binding domain-containing protein [Lachnospiraceae bacterium]